MMAHPIFCFLRCSSMFLGGIWLSIPWSAHSWPKGPKASLFLLVLQEPQKAFSSEWRFRFRSLWNLVHSWPFSIYTSSGIEFICTLYQIGKSDTYLQSNCRFNMVAWVWISVIATLSSAWMIQLQQLLLDLQRSKLWRSKYMRCSFNIVVLLE